MDWIKEYWSILSFVAVQFVGFVVAFTKMRGDLNQLRLDVNQLTGEMEPSMREFSRDLERRFDQLEARAVRERAEVMLAIKDATAEVTTRVGELERRTFDLMKGKGN